jgi:hypothetical protein
MLGKEDITRLSFVWVYMYLKREGNNIKKEIFKWILKR